MKRKFNVRYIETERKNISRPLESNIRKYVLFPNDNAVTTSLLEGWVYEEYLYHFISDNMIELTGTEIIEVGANNGNFTIEFAELVGDEGRVYAFEPQRIVFQQLCGNIFLNGLDNVYTFNAAVGHENGIVGVENVDYHQNGPVNFGDVHVVNDKHTQISIPLLTLDSIEFSKLSMIKIDVQGFEVYVIRGAIETIKQYRPFIFVEVEDDQLSKYGFSEHDLIKEIEQLNYTVIRFQQGIPYHTVSGVCLDCVCIPNEKLENQNFKIR